MVWLINYWNVNIVLLIKYFNLINKGLNNWFFWVNISFIYLIRNIIDFCMRWLIFKFFKVLYFFDMSLKINVLLFGNIFCDSLKLFF